MTKFMRRCSHQLKKWHMEFASGFKIFLSLILLSSFFTAGVYGQSGVAPVNPPPTGFNIDGRVVQFPTVTFTGADWVPQLFTTAGVPAAPYDGAGYVGKIFHKIDLQNDQADEVFTGGSKLDANPNTKWTWTLSKPTGKDDINNALIFITRDVNNDIWVLVSGDRKETNGTSYLDMEFYQQPIARDLTDPTGGKFISAGVNGGRTVGDLDVTLSYVGGGSVASISFLTWEAGVGNEGEFAYHTLTPDPGEAYVAANAGDVPVPFGAFGSTTYGALQFIEAAINVSALIGQSGDCALPFKTLFIKTKAAAVSSAELKDFIDPFPINPCLDGTPPTITSTTGTPSNGVIAGCNPSSAVINAALGSATASDNCGTPSVTFADGTVTTTGCVRSQTRTFTATDICGNTATSSRTASWIVDVTPPTISATGTPANGALGCNPTAAAIDGALGTASATDACGGATVSAPSDGALQSNGCLRSQTRTWTATDGCGNTSTTSRTATWTFDVTPPTITATGNALALGCNPTTATINGALGSASATDGCGGATVGTPVDGGLQSSGCLRSQTRTFTATDACGNTATTSRTATWTFDQTPPTITATGNPLALGCNPTSAVINGALGSASATDACGGATVGTPVDGSVQTSGCGRSQTRTFTATDACGNTATASRTATWTQDVTAPTITATGGSLTLGCNPSTATINGALGSASATDACGGATVGTPVDGTVQSNVCSRSQTRTFTATDACGNTATASRTATWTSDQTPPTITCSGDKTIACGATPAFDQPTASDACGTPSVTVLSTSSNSLTRTWVATDGCGNTATCSQTLTIGECLDNIFPTGTTCQNFEDQSVPPLNSLCFARSGGVVTNANNPGAWFYYTYVTKPAGVSTISVRINQTNDGVISYLFTSAEIKAWTQACTQITRKVTTDFTDPSQPVITIEFTGPSVNQALTLVISAKFNSNSIVGSPVSGSSSVYQVSSSVSLDGGAFSPVPNSGEDLIANECNAPVTTARPISESVATTDQLKVTAYPNPFKSTVKFTIESAVSGQAQLEIYNSVGQRASIVYNGYLQANRGQVVEYKAPRLGSNLIYILRVGGKQVTGKLLRME